MITNYLVQKALIAYLKSKHDIINAVVSIDSNEIRENQWQGTEFLYPNIRLNIMDNNPFMSDCGSSIRVSWLIFTEEESSKNADRLSGEINSVFHNKSFTSEGLTFTMTTINLVPAVREAERTWRSEIILRGVVTG